MPGRACHNSRWHNGPAAGDPRRAAEFLYRAVELARAADLLPWRIRDAEQTLAKAEAAVRALAP
jgi:hypothetical protein